MRCFPRSGRESDEFEAESFALRARLTRRATRLGRREPFLPALAKMCSMRFTPKRLNTPMSGLFSTM